MNKTPKIVLLGGASETAEASDWLAQAPVSAMVFWAGEATKEKVRISQATSLSVALADASGIVDATHPFDTQTRAAAMRASSASPSLCPDVARALGLRSRTISGRKWTRLKPP